ncbi:hypothetical protein ABT173_48190 [Streptomyces sp. NPDC001795]|uniref:hypothetical protein n=1 Tax=Streptomyces sp. NPDC001795 TaxID=3154525 RepID=UPI003333E364
MTREDRRALLSDVVIAHIEECAAAAPDPDLETIENREAALHLHAAGRGVLEAAPERRT